MAIHVVQVEFEVLKQTQRMLMIAGVCRSFSYSKSSLKLATINTD